ncbi:MAG: response regulator [Gemmatimonadota bacterium]
MNGAAVGPKRRVVVADDEPAIAMLTAHVLEHFGWEVFQALGGVEALAIARAERVDLMLLDVMMPDLDGRDACRMLKADEELGRIPVVLLSAADEHTLQWRAAGADAFLQKPFDIYRLRDLAERLLADGA